MFNYVSFSLSYTAVIKLQLYSTLVLVLHSSYNVFKINKRDQRAALALEFSVRLRNLPACQITAVSASE